MPAPVVPELKRPNRLACTKARYVARARAHRQNPVKRDLSAWANVSPFMDVNSSVPCCICRPQTVHSPRTAPVGMEVNDGRVILAPKPVVEVMSVADRGRDQYKPVLSGCGLVVEKCHAGFERPSSGVVGDVVNLVKYD